MTPTPKYVTNLLSSFNLVVVHLAALERQNAMLAEYSMPKRTNLTASIKWVLADALTDRTEEELNALYKNFNNIALKSCASCANTQCNQCTCYTDVPVQGAHEELSFLLSASRAGLLDLLFKTLGQNLPNDNKKRAVRLAARNASAAS
ncbi:hypothetical protein A0J61_11209 [Choanephora cucurbitarum]|uniref:Uncharacterized protein n=1 Tax=Choanephora cucurbitarum TaxID=101091 RepID=A0A1C7MV79_9FUNG|nr:hypothetical protein A0J61_11209 [Choanephora cucurbitarum]